MKKQNKINNSFRIKEGCISNRKNEEGVMKGGIVECQKK